MRVALILVLVLCVYLSEAGRRDSDESEERFDKGKHHKKDKYNKNGKYEKYDKYNKYNKNEKYNKYNKHEKKIDRDDSDESHESHEEFDGDFSPRINQRFGDNKYAEQEFKHYKYNKYVYEDDSRENNKKHHKNQKHYDNQPDSGFFDEAMQFSKRRLFSAPEDDVDSFFDDVKNYNQRYPQQPKWQHHKQPYPYNYPQYQQQKPHQEREWKQPSSHEDFSSPVEKYPGGESSVQEHVVGPNTRYNWKQDRENFPRMKPLSIPPPEKTFRDFVATTESPEPPAPSEAVKMARYIVHNADWTTVATISTQRNIKNYPFVNVLSVSDGPVEKGSGIPYLYMTELDMTPHDLAANRRCSLSMTLAETDYCKQQSLDPEDPRCAHLTLTGEMWRLRNGTQSAQLAEEALFSRHPVMKTWPKNHNFFFATLKIEQIVLLDYFGGPKYVDVKEYLRATPSP